MQTIFPKNPRNPGRFISRLICGAALAGAMSPGFAADAAPAPDIKFTWGGYVKADVLFSHFSDAPVAQSTARDFYVPNTSIPIAATGAEKPRNYLDLHAKETRLFLKTDTNIEGHKLGTHVEFDFISNQGTLGSEAVTNAYNPALRRAFITFDDWLIGQDWSTFQNLGALPETLDFVAFPSDGTIFVRQPQVRYTLGNVQLALENPETTVALNKAAAGASATYANTDDNNVPDFVARYNLKTDFGEFAVAGLARQLTDRGTVGGGNDTKSGFGGSLSGRIPVGADDIKFMLNGGSGVGRYLALNSVGDAVVDARGDLKRIPIINGYVAYRHAWDSKWRSTLTLSALKATTGSAASSNLAASATKNVESASVNLLYSPVSKLTFGSELRYARRKNVGNLDGTLSRLQFSAKYSF